MKYHYFKLVLRHLNYFNEMMNIRYVHLILCFQDPALLDFYQATLSTTRELTSTVSSSLSQNLSVNQVQPTLIQMLTSRACFSDANTKANSLYIMNHHVQAPTQNKLAVSHILVHQWFLTVCFPRLPTSPTFIF